MQQKIHEASTLFDSLPDCRKENINEATIAARGQKFDAIIVLDDDPTGTQTVYGIPVLTDWDEKSIYLELKKGTLIFFILTNSRALSARKADVLALELGKNIADASKKTEKKCLVISRGDSTLRGHYPGEVDALERGLGHTEAVRILIPAFFEGGRYTIGDIHYVKTGDKLIPAAQTPFAQDTAFGYENSDLKLWVEEKTQKSVSADKVQSVSIEDLRVRSLEKLVSKLNRMKPGTTSIVNAADYPDLKFFALALMQSNINPVLRTAASFVAALAALPFKPLLSKKELVTSGDHGGLVVIGSYVPKTSEQLEHLRQSLPHLHFIEINIRELLNIIDVDKLLKEYTPKIDHSIRAGKDVVVYTSRELITADTPEKNLDIGKKISEFITDIISNISLRPNYIITKGGITSSDIATESMGVKRAVVQGQIIEGVPVWKLGAESKFPGISYVIFPGNVGSERALTEAVEKLRI